MVFIRGTWCNFFETGRVGMMVDEVCVTGDGFWVEYSDECDGMFSGMGCFNVKMSFCVFLNLVFEKWMVVKRTCFCWC